MLICAILLLREVSWRKGKMIYIFSSRLDRKKKKGRGNEGEGVALSPEATVPVEGLFSEKPFWAF